MTWSRAFWDMLPWSAADRVAGRLQLLGQLLDAVLGATEDDHLTVAAVVEQLLERVHLAAGSATS